MVVEIIANVEILLSNVANDKSLVVHHNSKADGIVVVQNDGAEIAQCQSYPIELECDIQELCFQIFADIEAQSEHSFEILHRREGDDLCQLILQ